MKYPTIRIEGSILASDILEKIEQGEITGQRPIDFKIEGNFKVKDEIARSWADAKDYWRIFQRKREALGGDEKKTGTSETRSQWMIPFLSILGFKIEFAKSEEVNGKSYAISHRDNSLDGFPVHIMGFKDSLDKKRVDSGPRMSPHALVQEYLNLTEHLYAIATNGMQIRLLRDSSRLIKLSYIEFDLERMMEEEHYADFAILFRLLHYTRMPINQEAIAESLMEKYHQDSLESGSRIRDGLSDAVKKSIKIFANGFLSHPDNLELRKWFEEGDHNEKEMKFFQWQLRLIYRLLFLMVIEERDLIYPKKANKKLKNYYYDYYSLNKLRKLSEKRHLADPRFTDYWQSIRNTFQLFENEKYGKPLDIAPLSGLFESDQIGLLNTCILDNEVVMNCLRNLSIFRNKNNNQVMRVNYASLNVEEFGSVYEGLLEYNAVVQSKLGKPFFDLVKGSERSSSGSHYTPDELVQPLIKNSLDYIISDKLKEQNQEEALLSITVCDVACGSGHILLNAARRIATELAIVRTEEEQPSPSAFRQATRDVIRHSIYGVDLNPLAVELCKVALWLEAHNPNEPLNFLDHHIKCGNAIVGLAHRDELENGIADEAFKPVPGDDKEIAKAFLAQNKLERKERKAKEIQLHTEFKETTAANVQEAMAEYKVFKKMPEGSPKEIAKKQMAYKKFLDGKGYSFIKTLCDTQVAQFYIAKTEANKDRLITDNDFRQILNGYKGWQGQSTAKAMAIALDKRFFHWFLEFPEIFTNGGFSCILGNPPYLGGTKISTSYGNSIMNFLYKNFDECKDRCDLVAYFIRRNFEITVDNGYNSIITTDAIKSGDTLKGGLLFLNKMISIIFAIPTMPWPGKAATNVTLLSINKNSSWNKSRLLDNNYVDFIAPNLTPDTFFSEPNTLLTPITSSLGIKTYGDGFILKNEVAKKLSSVDANNYQVINKWIDGDDLNSSPKLWNGDFVINVNHIESEEELENKYPSIYSFLKENVKPYRDKLKDEKEWELKFKKFWWIHADKRIQFFDDFRKNKSCYLMSRAAKYLNLSKIQEFVNFSDNIVGYLIPNSMILVMQSTFHMEWSWYNSKKTGGSTLRYSTKRCLETFPFPKNIDLYENNIIDKYFLYRNELLSRRTIGLTDLFNLFHNRDLSNDTDLINLRKVFTEIDHYLLKIYSKEHSHVFSGFPAIEHDFYEIDYLPEKDNIRYTISPEARKEVLKRLLLLNHERFEEEIKQGLHKKNDVEAFYQQKGEAAPDDVKFSDRKSKSYSKQKKKTAQAKEKESPYKQAQLFEQPNLFNQGKKTIAVGSKVTIQREDNTTFQYHISKTAIKGQFTGEYKQIKHTSSLAEVMMGRKEGDQFVFGGVGYIILNIAQK